MPLTALELKHVEIRSKDYWLSDEKGLRLLIKASGAMYWRLKYRFQGKQKTLALGVFPDITLKSARLSRDKARLQLAEGIDPSREKQEKKRQLLMDDGKLFSVLALAWWNNQKGTWTEDHANRVWQRLRDNAFKELDAKPVSQIKPQDVLYVVREVETRGALDVASRVLQDIRRVFRFGVQVGKLDQNPATELTGVLQGKISKHRASLPINELGMFLNDLRQYQSHGRLLTQLALEILMFTFVRPGEVRGARWEEIDFKEKIWRIPASRMKMKSEHLVPLSKQALALIEKARPISGQYELIFPSERNRDEPLSDNTMRKAMFRLGYDGESKGKSRATPHGFRANASSVLNEQGFNPDAIERQLSHQERNGVRAAYIHHARYLDIRAEMMQWWADFLDSEQKKLFSIEKNGK